MSIPFLVNRAVMGGMGSFEPWLAEKLRKKNAHPRQPMVFSREKVYFWLSLPMICILSGPAWITVMIGLSYRDFETLMYGLIAHVILLLMWWIFSLGLWQRMGVDEEKVWYRYGRYYREVRFDEMLRFQGASPHNCLRVGRRRVYLHSKYFDYTLAHIRILEELQYRRFQIDDIKVDDPGWPRVAQSFRVSLVRHVLAEHKEFYDANPEERAYIEGLSRDPEGYDGPASLVANCPLLQSDNKTGEANDANSPRDKGPRHLKSDEEIEAENRGLWTRLQVAFTRAIALVGGAAAIVAMVALVMNAVVDEEWVACEVVSVEGDYLVWQNHRPRANDKRSIAIETTDCGVLTFSRGVNSETREEIISQFELGEIYEFSMGWMSVQMLPYSTNISSRVEDYRPLAEAG